MAVTCIWIHLDKKATTSNVRLQRPIPPALKAHTELVCFPRLPDNLFVVLCQVRSNGKVYEGMNAIHFLAASWRGALMSRRFFKIIQLHCSAMHVSDNILMLFTFTYLKCFIPSVVYFIPDTRLWTSTFTFYLYLYQRTTHNSWLCMYLYYIPVSTNTDLFSLPMGILMEGIHGSQTNPKTIMLPGNIQCAAPTVPLRLDLLDSLTVHAKMRYVNIPKSSSKHFVPLPI